jgi:alkaline phosphatase
MKKIVSILIALSLVVFLAIIIKNTHQVNEIEKSTLPIKEQELKSEKELVFGWISDIHLGEGRHGGKLVDLADEVIADIMPKLINHNSEFVVITGDLIDNLHKNHDQVIGYHKKVKLLLDQFPIDKYYVIGNHDVQTNSKKEFQEIYGLKNNYYSFVKKGITFIAIDQQFNPDGSSYDEGEQHHLQGAIHEDQLSWLKDELDKAPSKVVILTHQPIFSITSENSQEVFVEMFNGDKFNDIVNNSGKVLAVLSGHRQAKENEMRRVFDGVNHFIMPSAIFSETRFSHGVVRIDLEENKIDFDYYMDENQEELSKKFEEIIDQCKGKDEEADYYKILKLQKENLEEYKKTSDLFEKYKDDDFRSSTLLSERQKEDLKDFEDYSCYKKYLELKKEFFGTDIDI